MKFLLFLSVWNIIMDIAAPYVIAKARDSFLQTEVDPTDCSYLA